MSIKSKKSGTQFHGLKGTKAQPSPAEWAAIMLISGFPADPKVIAEGLGILNAESGFRINPGGDGAHFGAWQEDASFGSKQDRLDALKATQAAQRRWKADGESFYPAWGKWEKQQSGRNGADSWPQYKGIAEAAIKSGIGNIPNGSGINPLSPVESVIEGVESAEEFLQKALETLLDFRAMGNLAAQIFAWFLKLIAKAIWDYVIAPLVHWSERAVSFYWVNFFGTGTEQGSGIGYQLRNNAGAITILFWSIGYAVLWTDGSSASPVPSNESLLGQGVKGIEGAIARRNLTKPKDVKKKTPAKPDPKTSKVPIQRKQTFSVSRKRPVTVHSEGRQRVSSQRRFQPSPVPRPSQQRAEQKIILPPNVREKQRPKAQAPVPAKPGRPRVGA